MKSDLQEYNEGIYEVYEELATKILFKELIEEKYPNIYGESKNKQYKEPIPLVGSVAISPESGEDNSSSVKVKLLRLILPYLSLENANLDMDTVDKGVFHYQNEDYNVVSITPQNMFLGDFSVYSIICKKVK